jgi:hypothetical protein
VGGLFGLMKAGEVKFNKPSVAGCIYYSKLLNNINEYLIISNLKVFQGQT